MRSVFLCFFPSGNCSPSIPQKEHQSRGSGKCGKSENVKSEKKKREEKKKESGEIKSGLRLSPPAYISPPAAYYLANELGYVSSFVLATPGNVSTKNGSQSIFTTFQILRLWLTNAEVPKLWSTSAIRSPTLQEQIYVSLRRKS